jgi:hypothetical protein
MVVLPDPELGLTVNHGWLELAVHVASVTTFMLVELALVDRRFS